MLNPDSIVIPRWTIKHDTRSIGCMPIDHRLCHNRLQTNGFCSCRVVDYRILPGESPRITDGRVR